MSTLVTLPKLLTDIRRRIQDTLGDARTDAALVDQINDVLPQMFEEARVIHQDHDLALLEIDPTSGTKIDTGAYEYQIPEYVSEVRQVETWDGRETSVYPVARVPLGVRTMALGNTWHFSESHPTRIRIHGNPAASQRINIWYVRRWPPMHFGTLEAATSTTITFPASPTGDLVRRDDVYNGIQVALTNDSPAGTIGLVGKISDYVGSTRVATVDAAWATTPDATTEYSLVVPIRPEHRPLLVEEVTVLVLEEFGDDEGLVRSARRLERLRSLYKEGISDHGGRPKQIWSYEA